MDQAPAQTEQTPTKEAPETNKNQPPSHPVPSTSSAPSGQGAPLERSFRLNLSGQAQTALMQGRLMDDATRTKIKAQTEAKAERDQRKAFQEQKRAKIEGSKRRAIESDKLLSGAIARLVETDSTRASAHREGGRLIEQADRRVAESKHQMELAHEAVAKANEAHAKAIFEYGKMLSAAEDARKKWSPEHADATYSEARLSAQAAIVENERAWHDVSTKFRKEKRDRALRRSARELGLTMDVDEHPRRDEQPEADDSDQESEIAMEGTFVVPGAVEALIAEKQSMEELADFQKAGSSEDAGTP